MPDQTVVVTGGVISSVGPRSSSRVPQGSQVIDGRGRFLLPGFADMHVHLYTEGDAFTYLANGITTVRNMAGDASHLTFRRKMDSGELIGPRIITAGPIIETKLSHPDNTLVSSVDDARKEVERQHAAGYDFIKIYNALTPEIYAAVLTRARELKIAVAGHVPDTVGLREAILSRQSSIEHLRGYPYELLPIRIRGRAEDPSFRVRTLAWNSVRRGEMKRLAEETARSGVWNCPTFTFTVHELSPSQQHARLLARPETRWLSLNGLPKDRKTGYLADFSEEDFAAAQKGLNEQFRLLRALDEAGAGLLVGTDSWLSGYAFADELELLIKSGLSTRRVLRMATLDASRFLQEEKIRGSIRAGKAADLVLLSADPLIDIGNVRKVVGVVKAGRYYDSEFLAARIEELKSSKAVERK